ncbi:glycosyltransferase family 9 protein [Neisseriaceae bacterium JH1-16]|nr:glycosyltransferase family 9 protein [Neisseriaceae bacterium JH1-16]
MTSQKKILVIRRDNIGDLVCTTPLLDALRAAWPTARIDALVNSYNAGVIEGQRSLDQVHVYTKTKHRLPGQSLSAILLGRLRMYWALRRLQYDYAIIAGTAPSSHALKLAKAVRPKHIVGFVLDGQPHDAVIDLPVVRRAADPIRHQVEDVHRLLEPLGITLPPGPLSLTVPAEALAQARARIGAGPGRLVAVHISAREATRVWPVAHYIQLIEQLRAQGHRVLLLWSPGAKDNPRHPGDDEKAAEIIAALPADAVIPYPTSELGALMAALACVDLAVCCDGGGLHVAAGVGVPVVGLFEHLEGKYLHWYPWQVPHRVITSDSVDDWQIAHIAPQPVIDACFALLNSQAAQPVETA